MQFALVLLRMFVVFWFIEAPLALVTFFSSVNSAFNQLFSLTLLLKTFFKPWKNEYRKGLVGFSIFMGIFVKSIFIFADSLILFLLLIAECTFILCFVLLPIITVALLFLRL